MVKVFSRLTSNTLMILIWAGLFACSSSSYDANMEEILHGTISYPFIRSNPLGVNGKREKFVIRSISGSTEYVIEIPDAGEEYDIEIPLAALGQEGDLKPKGISSPAATDREIMASLPDMASEAPVKSALMDKAFGVGSSKGPKQAPSYTLGIAKITNLYQKRNYEYALIEVNHLLSFFPQSPRLHKMKGTIYVKLHNFPLAEKSWLTALEFTPNDQVLRRGIARLQEKIRRTYTPVSVPEEPQTSTAMPKAISKQLLENQAEQAPDLAEPALDQAEEEVNNFSPEE